MSTFKNMIINKGIKILCIGAHPDDIEIACGGSLLRLKQELDACINFLICTNGELKSPSAIRKKEQKIVGKFMDIKQVHFLDLNDGEIVHNLELTTAIDNELHSIEPDLVITHDVTDIHQDHRAVGLATIAATRSPNYCVLTYPSYILRQFNPNFFLDISDFIEQKVKLLSYFQSQSNSRYMQQEYIYRRAAALGTLCDKKYAEGFNMQYSIW